MGLHPGVTNTMLVWMNIGVDQGISMGLHHGATNPMLVRMKTVVSKASPWGLHWFAPWRNWIWIWMWYSVGTTGIKQTGLGEGAAAI